MERNISSEKQENINLLFNSYKTCSEGVSDCLENAKFALDAYRDTGVDCFLKYCYEWQETAQEWRERADCRIRSIIEILSEDD